MKNNDLDIDFESSSFNCMTAEDIRRNLSYIIDCSKENIKKINYSINYLINVLNIDEDLIDLADIGIIFNQSIIIINRIIAFEVYLKFIDELKINSMHLKELKEIALGSKKSYRGLLVIAKIYYPVKRYYAQIGITNSKDDRFYKINKVAEEIRKGIEILIDVHGIVDRLEVLLEMQHKIRDSKKKKLIVKDSDYIPKIISMHEKFHVYDNGHIKHNGKNIDLSEHILSLLRYFVERMGEFQDYSNIRDGVYNGEPMEIKTISKYINEIKTYFKTNNIIGYKFKNTRESGYTLEYIFKK